MKKLERIKTLQLAVFFVLALLCIYFIIIKSDTYYQIAESKELQTLVALLWVVLFATFLFVFLDFTLFAKQKTDFNALDYAVHSDPLAKIANRQGCDEIIEKYIDQPLPPDMGVVMFLLTSLNDINRYHNRLLGNKQIRNFSIILKLASTDICFVGRNGGNVFMAIFEKQADENLDLFLSRISDKVIEYNNDKESLPMYYNIGTAIESDNPDSTINMLISKAHKKAQSSKLSPRGVVTIKDMLIAQGVDVDSNPNVPKLPDKSNDNEDSPDIINAVSEVNDSSGVVKTTKVEKKIVDGREVTETVTTYKRKPFYIPDFAIAAKLIIPEKPSVKSEEQIQNGHKESYSYTDEEIFGILSGDDDSYKYSSLREAV